MQLNRRKIILTGKRLELSELTLDEFNSCDSDYLILDPVSLFKEIDWINAFEKPSILNSIYEKLFEAFLIENKTLVCYWPAAKFPDQQSFSLLESLKKSSIRIVLNYFNEEINTQTEMPYELQNCWEKLVLELIEAISNDLILNEGLVEIAHLKKNSSSITIFSQTQSDKLTFFYLNSDQEIFDFEPQYAFEKSSDVNYVSVFGDFEDLVASMQSEVDLTSYNVNFIDGKLEKIFFNSLIKKDMEVNLIQSWMDSYFLN